MPRKHEALIWDLVLLGRSYAVEVLRRTDGRWRTRVSFTPTAAEPVCGTDRGVVGIALNLTGRRGAGKGRVRGTGPLLATGAGRAIALRSGWESLSPGVQGAA